MALRSRRQREQEQKRRMARGRRNLSQLAGPQAQGQRTPMNRGSGSVSTVQAPPFQESNVGNDIAQAGLAYKGASGINDFVTGTDAYIDKAGKAVPAKAPFSFGDQSILGEGGHVDEYFGKVGNRWNEATEGAKGLFGTPTPQPGFGPASSVPASGGGGLFGSPNTPTSPPPGSYGVAGGMGDLTNPMDSATQTMNNFDLGGDVVNSNITGLSTQQGILGGPASVGSQSMNFGGTTATNALSAGNNFAGVGQAAGSTATAVNAASKGAEAATAAETASSGLQGGTGQPWMAYANIAKDLFVGGPGSEKITGSTAGDAAIRAAAAYYTFGLSEIPYALF
jgi:hypothetical protein